MTEKEFFEKYSKWYNKDFSLSLASDKIITFTLTEESLKKTLKNNNPTFIDYLLCNLEKCIIRENDSEIDADLFIILDVKEISKAFFLGLKKDEKLDKYLFNLFTIIDV